MTINNDSPAESKTNANTDTTHDVHSADTISASAATPAPSSSKLESKSKSSPSAARESALLHRSLLHPPHHVVSASGLYLTLVSGRRILDACGGAAVSCIGHGNGEVAAAVARQLGNGTGEDDDGGIGGGGVGYVHTLTYTTGAAEDLAHFLLDGGIEEGEGKGNRFGLSKAYFVGSGSEAMDASLKLARQYFYELGQTNSTDVTSAAAEGEAKKGSGRWRFVARRQAYHGNTIGAMAVSSNLPRKKPYANLQVPGVSWVSPAYAYQYSNWRDGEREEEFAARLVKELEEHFLELGPESVIAFIAEPLVGATSGCTPAPRGYFTGVRRVCDKYGILLILDEVMCGTGRTGTMFAFEQEGIVPDLLTLGKGLGGGYSPIAAVLVHEKVIGVLSRGTASFNHGHTYQAHPVSCAASLAVQKILRRDGLIENCRKMGEILHAMLMEAFSKSKYVGDFRGRGLFWGIEFVENKETREPFDPKVAFGPRFQQMAFEMGVAVYPGAGTVDGTKGDHAIISPPYNITEEQLKDIVDVLKKVYAKLEHEVDQTKSESPLAIRP